jgi:hypothetical protein
MDVARVLGFLERELDLFERLDPDLAELPDRERPLRLPPDCFLSAISGPLAGARARGAGSTLRAIPERSSR